MNVGFLNSMKSLLAGGGGRDKTGYWVYVRCSRCGEAIKTRIDLQNDLSLVPEGGFIVSKTLVGNRLCFERIEAALAFDESRQLTERRVKGGDFITAEEYEAAYSS